MAGVVEAKSAAEFSKILQNVGSQIVVVHFWADWAPQCQQVNDVVAELAKASKNTAFVKVEAEKVPEISQKFKISAVPTCLILKNEVEVDRVNGVNAAELTKKVGIHSQTSVAMGGNNSTPSTMDPKEALNARLKKLVNAAPVMVFMKGSPEEPRCGFSKTLVQILKDQSVSYASFNILADDSVRQGLKEYSNWPTFPQVYAKGELVGGLDIIKELVESGELQSQMPQAETLDDRLARLVKQQRVMLFMKGNPDTPRCGFSKTTCSILAETGVPYGHFDILSDDEVRQGLKTYSNWPTYPQLYVQGELIGGLDIIKELKETGDLESTLKSVE